MDTPPVEMMREVTAREMAKLLNISPQAASRRMKNIPQAHRESGPNSWWHCPLWAVLKDQEQRGKK